MDKINKEYIGKRLKDIRKKLNLTQSKIAKECMISQTTYSNYILFSINYDIIYYM